MELNNRIGKLDVKQKILLFSCLIQLKLMKVDRWYHFWEGVWKIFHLSSMSYIYWVSIFAHNSNFVKSFDIGLNKHIKNNGFNSNETSVINNLIDHVEKEFS